MDKQATERVSGWMNGGLNAEKMAGQEKQGKYPYKIHHVVPWAKRVGVWQNGIPYIASAGHFFW